MRLMDLIIEISVDRHEKHSTWITKKRRWGSKNDLGFRRYYKDRETASKFASGEKRSPRKSRPIPKIKATRKEKKIGPVSEVTPTSVGEV